MKIAVRACFGLSAIFSLGAWCERPPFFAALMLGVCTPAKVTRVAGNQEPVPLKGTGS